MKNSNVRNRKSMEKETYREGNHTICLISAYEIFLLLYDGKPESYQDFRESMVAIQYWRLDPGTPEK